MSWCLVSRPIPSAYQHLGNESGVSCPETFPECPSQLNRHDCVGQFVGSGLHSKGRRYPLSVSLHGGVEDSSLVPQPSDYAACQTYPWQDQYSGRSTQSYVQSDFDRVVTETINLQCPVSSYRLSEHRPVCNSTQQQTPTVCLSDSRQQSSFSGCLVNELGQDSRICFSSVPYHSQSPQQSQVSSVPNSTDSPILASSFLVPGTTSVGGPKAYNSSSSSRPSKSTKRKNLPSKSSNALPSHLDIIKQSIRDRQFLQRIADHVSRARRVSTRKVYEAKWEVFTAWCSRRKISPVSASSINIADFLLYLFEEKTCQVSTIKGYRAMISNTLKLKNGAKIGSDPIISELIRSFEFQRPVQRSLLPKWDLACVLSSLCKGPYEPLSKASLLHLTQKTVFLLTLATAGRVSEIHALAMDPEHLRFNESDGSVSLRTQSGFIAKNQLPSVCSAEILVPNLARTVSDKDFNRMLCPVRALKLYLRKTESIRNNRKRLFLPIRGNHDITKGSIYGWISSVIRLAYKSISKVKFSSLRVKPHELRALSTSWAYASKVPMDDIVKAAVWSSGSVFARFYLRDFSKQSYNLSLMGPLVTAQKIVGGGGGGGGPVGQPSQRC